MNKAPRVNKEYQELKKFKEIEINQIGNDIYHWKAVINGASDTVYDGGKYQIDIVIPDEYPYQPPKVDWN